MNIYDLLSIVYSNYKCNPLIRYRYKVSIKTGEIFDTFSPIFLYGNHVQILQS